MIALVHRISDEEAVPIVSPKGDDHVLRVGGMPAVWRPGMPMLTVAQIAKACGLEFRDGRVG